MRVTLVVPQGLGDVFWVYQKVEPHVDAVKFEVCLAGKSDDPAQDRSLPWLRLLPKCDGASLYHGTPQEYRRLAYSRFDLAPCLEDGKRSFYAVNAPLNAGTRLDELDDLEVAWRVRLPIGKRLIDTPYLCLYVSRGTLGGGKWTPAEWARLVTRLLERGKTPLSVQIIGAHFDWDVMTAVAGELLKRGQYPSIVCGAAPEVVMGIIRRAAFFVGYQSGLSVMADQLGTPQLMVYFPHLDKLRRAWPLREHLDDGTYQTAMFSQTVEEVAEETEVTW